MGSISLKPGKFNHNFHQYLVEAFEQRQIGDYEPMEEITKESARKNIDRAEEFLVAVRLYLEKTK